MASVQALLNITSQPHTENINLHDMWMQVLGPVILTYIEHIRDIFLCWKKSNKSCAFQVFGLVVIVSNNGALYAVTYEKNLVSI